MQELGLKSIVKKKNKITTDSEHKFTIAKNYLNREFITAKLIKFEFQI